MVGNQIQTINKKNLIDLDKSEKYSDHLRLLANTKMTDSDSEAERERRLWPEYTLSEDKMPYEHGQSRILCRQLTGYEKRRKVKVLAMHIQM